MALGLLRLAAAKSEAPLGCASPEHTPRLHLRNCRNRFGNKDKMHQDVVKDSIPC